MSKKSRGPASVGIRELKNQASRIVKRVEAGETIQITDRARPVATIVPFRASRSTAERLRVAAAAGALAWSGRKVTLLARPPRLAGSPAADAVIEDRR